MNDGDLFDQLAGVTPIQFDELLLRLEIDESYLSARETPLRARAIELLRLLRQREDGVARLRRLLDDLGWFRRFLPEGAYPVGPELRTREEGNEQRLMEEAARRGEDPEAYRVTPRAFYAFHRDAAWLGVFRGWDSPRGFHAELIAWTTSAAGSRHAPRAAIVGPGGSGKSIALRRLAVDLAEQGHRVWWVDDVARFLRGGLSSLAEFTSGAQFVFVDDIEHYEDEAARFRREAERRAHIVWVVAGRQLPTSLRGGLRPNAGLFVPDEAADRVEILRKIAEVIPEWAAVARHLEAEALRHARLIRLLVVLARQTRAPTTLEGLEDAFLRILADDIRQIRAVVPGLAEALIDAAGLREVGSDLDHETMTALAERHQRGARVLLERVEGNERWLVAQRLVSQGDASAWRFHHDELAEGLVRAGQRGMLGERVVGDDAWRVSLLDWLMDHGAPEVAAKALFGVVCGLPALLSAERGAGYVHRLLARGVTHDVYLYVILRAELAADRALRLDLLEEAARRVPQLAGFWRDVTSWLMTRYTGDERAAFAARLRAAVVATPYPNIEAVRLACLGEAARAEARGTLAAVPGDHEHLSLVQVCLDLLGPEAHEGARRLLRESADPGVLQLCLSALGDVGAEEATRLLAESRGEGTHKDVLLLALRFAGDSGRREAARLLALPLHYEVQVACLKLLAWDAREHARRLLKESRPAEVVHVCLLILGEEAKGEARRLLAETKAPEVITACLRLLGGEAAGEARRLLKECNDATVLQTCLSLLGDEGRKEARLLLRQRVSSQILCACLKCLGEGAQEDAKRLLRECREPNVIIVCLTLLGERAKEDARRLLGQQTPAPVVVVCLRILGDEAKEDARRLLRQQTPAPVVVVCLKILGDEAKEDARRFLKERKEPDLLFACLGLLGDEAKGEARRFLAHPATVPEVQAICVKVLGAEAIAFAMEQVRLWKHRSLTLVIASLEVIAVSPEGAGCIRRVVASWSELPSPLRTALLRVSAPDATLKKRAREIFYDWRAHHRAQVEAALIAFADNPGGAIEVCDDILRWWRHEIEFAHLRRIKLFDRHIARALTHPSLRHEARRQAETMLAIEAATPGFLTPDLCFVAERVARGEFPAWGTSVVRPATKPPERGDGRPSHPVAASTPTPVGTAAGAPAAEHPLDPWPRLSARERLRVLLATPVDGRVRARAREVLAEWMWQPRDVVAAAIGVYRDNPAAVREVCRSVLQYWRSEIDYQRSNAFKRYDGHIVAALANPALHAEATPIVGEMLQAEASTPNFLTAELLEFARRFRIEALTALKRRP